jgi:hypothetical protein
MARYVMVLRQVRAITKSRFEIPNFKMQKSGFASFPPFQYQTYNESNKNLFFLLISSNKTKLQINKKYKSERSRYHKFYGILSPSLEISQQKEHWGGTR